MASSLIRFSKFPSIAADRSIETFTKERDQPVDCVSKASPWRAQRLSISPTTYATTRLSIRSLLTTPKPDSPSQQAIIQATRLQIQLRSTQKQLRSIQTRPVKPNPNNDRVTTTTTTTTTTTPPPTNHLLAQQRLNRPVAPHLSIYRRQITSVLSVLQRLTGLTLSAAFTLFPILYLSSTHLGLGLDLSADSIAASFGSLPWIVKFAVKFGVAWIFTFHGLNSLRFLAWKFARGVTNKDIAISGWAVVGGSVLGAVGFVWFV
jgi:succinate dehydrogenase (ubiquinone) cytochrome b560 subunit